MGTKQEVPKVAVMPAASLVDRYWSPSLDAMTHGVSLQDRHHKILRANSGLSALLGKPGDEIIGRKGWSLFYGTDRVPKSCPLYREMQAHEHVEVGPHLPAWARWSRCTAMLYMMRRAASTAIYAHGWMSPLLAGRRRRSSRARRCTGS